METNLDDIVVFMAEKGFVKFGEFTLKSGKTSPIYMDFRQLISHPVFMGQMVQLLVQEVKNWRKFDLVTGIPYNGIPLATVYSMQTGTPMIYHRKEAKDYGTKQMIEGQYTVDQTVLLLDDVLTTGGSVLATARMLEDQGLKVGGICVLVDRRAPEEQTDKLMLDLDDGLKKKIPLKSLFTLSQLVRVLKAYQGHWTPHLKDPHVPTYEQRLMKLQNEFAQKVWALMHQKSSNLVLSADFENFNDLIKLVDQVGSKICVLKTHLDAGRGDLAKLAELKSKHNFLILEDRKFSDIGNTVKMQMSELLVQVPVTIDAVTAHSVMGPGVIQGLQAVAPDVGILLVAQASSGGNLISEEYTTQTVNMAEQAPKAVAGFIAQRQLTGDHFLTFTPGVHLKSAGDQLQQTYRTPDLAMGAGADLIIVGRGITQAENPIEAAELYRRAGWHWFTTYQTSSSSE